MADSASVPPGLPPVVPPSGRMIAQLFIIPLGIVIGAVVVFFTFSWLVAGSRTPEGFLDGLRNPNAEVRWRAASDLAQTLPRDDALASDPGFGLELAAMLNDARAALLANPATRPSDVSEDERRVATQKWLEYLKRRNEVQYLTACVGNLTTTLGAGVLSDMATGKLSHDEKSDALLRRQAVWALATAGNNRLRFDRLPAQRQAEILAELDAAAARAGDKATWAAAAADTLRGRGSPAVIAALAKVASADDPFLRKEAALALGLWTGSDADNRKAEETLLKLTRDDGRGQSIRITEDPLD